MRAGERVRGVESLDYIVLCISERSFGTMVVVTVLGCRGDECPRQITGNTMAISAFSSCGQMQLNI